MATSALLLTCLALLQPQQPPIAAPKPAPDRPLRLCDADPGDQAATFGELGLGDGGVRGVRGRGAVDGEATTAGGVRVECRSVGVHLTFASGRELLYTESGFLHLRDGAECGPFADGVCLLLADGASVLIERHPSRQPSLQEVVVAQDGSADRVWTARHGRVLESVRPRALPGPVRTLLCLGDGGVLYRAWLHGPLLACQRALAPQDCTLPPEQLVLLTQPMRLSMLELPRRFPRPRADLAPAVRAAASVAEASGTILSAEADRPRRLLLDNLRYSIGGGFELAIDGAGDGPLLLQLCVGQQNRPFVEWTVAHQTELRLGNPEGETLGRRYVGRGVSLPPAIPALQIRTPEDEAAFRAVVEKVRRGK